MKKTISIIIVNWNGKKWLSKCLKSLENQDYPYYEIVFVDNDSKDDSVAYVKRYFPKVKVIENKENSGFAGGNNLGLKYAKGKYILLLNNDTWVEKSFLSKFIKAFDEIPNLGIAQSKIVLMDSSDKLDQVGSYWTDSSFLYHYGYGKDANLKKYNTQMPFFTCKGASVLIRRDLIDKIELFDDDFWCYYEDTDFCQKVWIAGFECWYYPKALVHHAMGGTSLRFDNSYIQFHNFKNKLLSFLKNFELKSLITVLPVYLILNIGLSITWLLQGKSKHCLALYKSIWWNITHFKATMQKRKVVQSFRRKSDSEINKITKRNPKISYYYHLFTSLEKYEE